MDSYDNDKVLARIQQLLKQFNVTENIEIVFGPIDPMASYSHWSCNELNSVYYRKIVFFNLMQNLLNVFIEYRNSFNFDSHNHGIIKINHKETLIKWVDESNADKEISRLKGEINGSIR